MDEFKTRNYERRSIIFGIRGWCSCHTEPMEKDSKEASK